MKNPNFIIIGAPKAGTTSLYHYLQQHPSVEFPTMKEPKYFSFDKRFLNSKDSFDKRMLEYTITDQNEYKRLFEKLTADFVGEASPQYLESDLAAKRIYEYNPNMKIVAVLRNPATRAYSGWKHNIRKGIEVIKNFRKAIESGDKRNLKSNNMFTDYLKAGKYAENLNRYYNYFPKKNIHIIFFEDFISSPNNTLNNLMKFLNPDHSGFEFETDNIYMENKFSPRNLLLYKLSKKLSKKAPIIAKIITHLNTIKPLSKADRKFLLNYYLADIQQLEKMTGRSLKDWKIN